MKKKEEMAWWDFPDYTQNTEKYMDELSSSSQVWTHLKRLSHANGQTEEFPADTGDKNKHRGVQYIKIWTGVGAQVINKVSPQIHVTWLPQGHGRRAERSLSFLGPFTSTKWEEQGSDDAGGFPNMA